MTYSSVGAPAAFSARASARVALAPFLARYAKARGPRAALRLAVKIARRPSAVAHWLAEIDALPGRRGWSDADFFAAAIAPLRPFLRAGLSFEQRLAIARSHHLMLARWSAKRGSGAGWPTQPRKIGVVEGRRGAQFALWCGPAEFSREGAHEIIIAPDCGDARGAPLARLTFSFAEIAETGWRRNLLIGGLQGPREADGKAAIVAATRAMRGLRPKAAALLAAQGLAAAAGCVEIRAVSDARHVIQHAAAARRGAKIARYDDFWRERGGAPDDFLGFLLPGRPSRLDDLRQSVVECGAAVWARADEATAASLWRGP